ncbi:hypothetical protein BH24CHL4_BH24CHL4_27520 [soil metagenome]
MRRILISCLALLGLILASTDALAEAVQPAAELPACAAAGDATPVAEDDLADRPEWQPMELTNAATGETFTVAELAGCTILVEPMATWCVVCFDQMQRNQEALADLGTDDYLMLVISIETELAPEDLARYAEETGFPFLFTVAPVDLLVALEETFGRSLLVPPATPQFYIAADGSTSDLILGGASAETIVEEMERLAREGAV